MTHYLRLLCGIACSNPVPPARTISCVAISQCTEPPPPRIYIHDLLTFLLGGAWVTDAREQKALLDVLQMVDREDKWPTLSAQQTLKTQWESEY